MLLASSVHDGESFLLIVLVQLAVIIAAARAGGWLFARIGQPQVVGEIAAGLLLGPSFLGRISPATLETIFPAQVESVFQVLGQLGLVFLMFLIGLEFEFGHLRRLGRAAGSVAVAGIALPFVLGLGLGLFMHSYVAPEVSLVGFTLFLATALSITAIPILGRIMLEFGISRTPLGALTISAAAVDDALGWILLAAVSAIVIGDFQVLPVAGMIGMTCGFVLGVRYLVRPLVLAWIRRVLPDGSTELGLVPLSAVILVVLASAVATNWIGVFSIFGPFVLGAMLWDQTAFREAVSSRLRDFVNAFFLPVFFTYSGLRTNIGLLDSGTLWAFCLLVTLAAVAGKVAGCGLAARAGGLPWRESACVAVMMNTRALMGLIAINVGRDLGVIPDSVFCMLVIMALVTTFMTSPLLRRLIRASEPAAAPESPPPEMAREAGATRICEDQKAAVAK